MAHVFFQEFGIPGQQPEQLAPEQVKYNTNCLIFEISNNWPYVRWMMDRYRHQELKQVDPMEKDWLDFIISKNIDVEKYEKNSSEFINEYIEKLA
jgi:hypothetical protein